MYFYTIRDIRELHDRLRYVLEDPQGNFYHEEAFEREFDAMINKED